jgi:hypothetical protein
MRLGGANFSAVQNVLELLKCSPVFLRISIRRMIEQFLNERR